MNTNERMMKICSANPKTLAQIDAILQGNAPARNAEPNVALWTISATARKIGVSRNMVVRMVREGLITGVNTFPGNTRSTIRISAKSVEDYIARQTVGVRG